MKKKAIFYNNKISNKNLNLKSYKSLNSKYNNLSKKIINFRRNIELLKNAINGLERPKYLCKEKKHKNIKIEKPKKEKVKKIVQKCKKLL